MKYDEKDPAKRILALEARIQRQRSEIKSLMIRVLDAEPKARHFSARWLEQGDEIVVLRKRIAELEAALAEAREDSVRLQAMEDGKLSCQYRGGATPSMDKWIVAYAATPIAGGSTLRAAIDAVRGNPHASK